MKKIGWLLIILLLNGVIYSYSILDAQDGNELEVYNGRSAALGNTGVALGMRLFDSFLNPANQMNLKSNLGFQYGMNLYQVNEKRSLPMYNSFDAYSGEATYVDNLNYYNYHSAGIFYNHKLADFTFGAAVLYNPAISFDADYFEEVRNNFNSDNNGYPPILAKNYIESEGVVNSISGNLAFKYKDMFSLGLMISSLSGDAKWEREIIWQDAAIDLMSTSADTLFNSYNIVERDFSAMQFTLGANYRFNDRFDIGISYQPETEFDVTGNVDGIDVDDAVYMYYSKLDSLEMVVHTDSIMYSEYKTPSKMRAGISYQPQNIMKTYFYVELEQVGWSGINKLYDDQFNYYLGVEHVLPNSIPIRLGFSFITEYGLHDQSGITFANKIMKPTFSAGTGFKILDNFTVDLGLQYSNRQYEALDLFMDSYYDYSTLWANYQYLNLQDRGWENPDTVKETFLELKTSVSFDW
ncbi:MAG: outer membrane protein transport protein [Candidatus Cloacimonetes bacterium]|nr:outer membrane protein transport protein [Candidatus Cloacimonadota bacterium]MCF7812912.1 outer membrane protein transport protein [Candidatus Cloacimonadota bacterium]MCF7867124.1 outer membrane protein transport protein [Candidatus Cloacimonadota bacterium]MCF7882556.1 outer membrane protein transport protein [Candidatus Cloacimonadota bacterium]